MCKCETFETKTLLMIININLVTSRIGSHYGNKCEIKDYRFHVVRLFTKILRIWLAAFNWDCKYSHFYMSVRVVSFEKYRISLTIFWSMYLFNKLLNCCWFYKLSYCNHCFEKILNDSLWCHFHTSIPCTISVFCVILLEHHKL